MNVREMIDLLGGRKFVIFVGLCAISTVFLYFQVGGIDFSQWADFQVWNAGIYGTTNGVSKAATSIQWTAKNNPNKPL